MDNPYYTPLDWDGAFMDALLLIWKEFWPFILAFLGLYILAVIIKTAVENDERKRRKQREQEEFERRIELFLRKKDEHDAAKRLAGGTGPRIPAARDTRKSPWK